MTAQGVLLVKDPDNVQSQAKLMMHTAEWC